MHSANHQFYNRLGQVITYTTEELIDACNISCDYYPNIVRIRWPMFANVVIREYGTGLGINESQFQSALENAIIQYRNLTWNYTAYKVNIVRGFYYVSFSFSSDPDNFEVPPTNSASAYVYHNANTGEILPSSHVFFNDTNQFYNSYGGLRWYYDGDTPPIFVSLQDVVLHELGHILGFRHIWGTGANATIMQAYFPPSQIIGELHHLDKKSVLALYGDASTDSEIDTIPIIQSQIFPNHPNPFNPSTTISYSLADNIQNPKIEIYNIKGQKVKSYALEEKTGENSIIWHGKDENDKGVSSGVYFYRLLNEGKVVDTKKMLLIK
jgi:hypothetical protein